MERYVSKVLKILVWQFPVPFILVVIYLFLLRGSGGGGGGPNFLGGFSWKKVPPTNIICMVFFCQLRDQPRFGILAYKIRMIIDQNNLYLQ